MSAFGRLIKLANSKQGRKILTEAQKAARDPKNRERLAQARSRFQKSSAASTVDPQEKQPPTPDRDGIQRDG